MVSLIVTMLLVVETIVRDLVVVVSLIVEAVRVLLTVRVRLLQVAGLLVVLIGAASCTSLVLQVVF